MRLFHVAASVSPFSFTPDGGLDWWFEVFRGVPVYTKSKFQTTKPPIIEDPLRFKAKSKRLPSKKHGAAQGFLEDQFPFRKKRKRKKKNTCVLEEPPEGGPPQIWSCMFDVASGFLCSS